MRSRFIIAFLYVIFIIVIPPCMAWKFLYELRNALNYTRLEFLIEWAAMQQTIGDFKEKGRLCK